MDYPPTPFDDPMEDTNPYSTTANGLVQVRDLNFEEYVASISIKFKPFEVSDQPPNPIVDNLEDLFKYSDPYSFKGFKEMFVGDDVYTSYSRDQHIYVKTPRGIKTFRSPFKPYFGCSLGTCDIGYNYFHDRYAVFGELPDTQKSYFGLIADESSRLSNDLTELECRDYNFVVREDGCYYIWKYSLNSGKFRCYFLDTKVQPSPYYSLLKGQYSGVNTRFFAYFTSDRMYMGFNGAFARVYLKGAPVHKSLRDLISEKGSIKHVYFLKACILIVAVDCSDPDNLMVLIALNLTIDTILASIRIQKETEDTELHTPFKLAYEKKLDVVCLPISFIKQKGVLLKFVTFENNLLKVVDRIAVPPKGTNAMILNANFLHSGHRKIFNLVKTWSDVDDESRPRYIFEIAY